LRRGSCGEYLDENGKWRKLHYEKLYNLYSLYNILRVIKSRRLTRMKEGRSALEMFTPKTTGKRLLGRVRRR
jgi:hypothetical protein